MARILITGGEGFVGRNLRKNLKKHKVISLDISNPDKKKDVINIDLVNHDPRRGITKKFDVVFHLASFIKVNEIAKKPLECIRNNTISTLNLLEDIKLNNPKFLFVFASIHKVYGLRSVKIKQETSLDPKDAYAASKVMCEHMIRLSGLKYTIVRSGIIFGPGQGPGLFIPKVITDIVRGKKELKVGNLNMKRNLVHIDDISKFYASLAGKKTSINKTFNVCSYNKKIKDILDDIIDLANKDLGIKVKYKQDKNLIRKNETVAKGFSLDCSLANKILKWKPTKNYKEALKNTFEGYL